MCSTHNFMHIPIYVLLPRSCKNHNKKARNFKENETKHVLLLNLAPLIAILEDIVIHLL